MTTTFVPPDIRLTLGVSGCLLGEAVRFDGGHKRDSFINDVLGKYFCFKSYCPEVAIGLGTPRPPIRLISVAQTASEQTADVQTLRVRGVRDPTLDVTDQLIEYAQHVANEIPGFVGYLFKSKSPSCGMARVKVYDAKAGMPMHHAGMYAHVLQNTFPDMPMEEEGRLNDPILRENFILRVYVYARWLKLRTSAPSFGDIVAFHTQHKLLLLAHNQAAYRRLGQMVAIRPRVLDATWLNSYQRELMACVSRKCNRRSHANVLQHILGYFKNNLTEADKVELVECIDQYRVGQIPLIVPIKLFKNVLRRYPNEYLANQIYFSPYPDALGLRNQV